jgi:hypothetical protein
VVHGNAMAFPMASPYRPSSFARAALLLAGVHAAVIACPSLALAQSGQVAQTAPTAPGPHVAPASTPPAAGSDVVYLKNGGILRGTIIDAVPNERVRMQLATGEIATVAWADVGRIEHGGDGSKTTVTTPGASAATPAPAAAADKGTLSPAQSLVWVHIEGSDDAQLEQDTSGQDDWAVVCSAPCDKQLSTGYWYRISGGGIRASKQFALQGTPGQRETLTVSPASKGWFIVGVVAVPVGAIVAYFGLIFGLVGSAASWATESTANGTQTTQAPAGLAATGWTMFALGAVAAVGGLVLTIANWKTGVSQDIGGGKAASTASAAPASDAWTRLPTPMWRETPPEQAAVPPAVAFPVLSGSF